MNFKSQTPIASPMTTHARKLKALHHSKCSASINVLIHFGQIYSHLLDVNHTIRICMALYNEKFIREQAIRTSILVQIMPPNSIGQFYVWYSNFTLIFTNCKQSRDFVFSHALTSLLTYSLIILQNFYHFT